MDEQFGARIPSFPVQKRPRLNLAARNRRIYAQRLQGMTLRDVGLEVGLSPGRVRQICRRVWELSGEPD
jgi:DNA-binding CsgD family transcriptional regulator